MISFKWRVIFREGEACLRVYRPLKEYSIYADIIKDFILSEQQNE